MDQTPVKHEGVVSQQARNSAVQNANTNSKKDLEDVTMRGEVLKIWEDPPNDSLELSHFTAKLLLLVNEPRLPLANHRTKHESQSSA